jgi:hypothetical protein
MRFFFFDVGFVGFLKERAKEFIGRRGCSTLHSPPGLLFSKPDPVDIQGSSGGLASHREPSWPSP